MKRSFIIVAFLAFFFVSCEQNSLKDNSSNDSLLSFINLGNLPGGTIDIQSPVISLFSGTGPDPTITSLIPFNLAATDDVGITGWMITETPTSPLPGDPGWLIFQPSSYTITSGYGTYDLHVWARDFAGNVSALSANSHFTIDYNDTNAPVIATFSNTGPNPTGLNTVPVTMSGSDNVGITGWMITESSIAPLAGDPGWLSSQPSSYIISSGFGTYNLHVWAKDLAGNVSSVSGSSHFTIVYGDLDAPIISQFYSSGPNPTSQPAIPVTIVASDNVLITGWMINELSTPPLPGDPGWLSGQPTAYTIAGYGAHNLYLWAKDLAGNVSALNASSHFTINYIQAFHLLRTGQTACYDAAGILVACGSTGQDGELQRGLVWPGPRFTNNGLTITDNLTGLIWVADANLAGAVTWDNTFTFVSSLNTGNYGGRTDWRLPNILELMSIMNFGTNDMTAWLVSFGFSNLASGYYWSSTTYQSNRDSAWGYLLSNGYKNIITKTSTSYVLAVSSTSTVLPKTGQIVCSNAAGTLISCTGTGQDGELQMGISWPSPRFTNNGLTMTDNLTGLMWTKDANLMNTQNPTFDNTDGTQDGQVPWQTALNYINYLNGISYGGYNDWRLPNDTEMLSIHNHGATSLWLITSGFTNGGSTQNHWTSTTYEFSPDTAFFFNAPYGSHYYGSKLSTSHFVWPVRGGY